MQTNRSNKMSERNPSGLVTFTVTATKEQLGQLNKAWKRDEKTYNRSDFIRAAINAYSGEKIF